MANVDSNTNFNYNTNQIIYINYNEKEIDDMSALPFHNTNKKGLYKALKINHITPHLNCKNYDYFVDIDPDINMNTTSI